jgi:hypothetical protein
MHGLQHVAVSTQSHHNVSFFQVSIAVVFHHAGKSTFGSWGLRSEEGDLFIGHAGLVTLTVDPSSYMEGHDVQTDFSKCVV